MTEIRGASEEMAWKELEEKITLTVAKPKFFKGHNFVKWKFKPETNELKIAPSTTIIIGDNENTKNGTFDRINNRLDLGGTNKLTEVEKLAIEAKIRDYFNQ